MTMTKEQHALLRPHAVHFQAMTAHIMAASDDELEALRQACATVSDSNCGWDIYDAGKWMLSEIEAEQRRRIAYHRENAKLP